MPEEEITSTNSGQQAVGLASNAFQAALNLKWDRMKALNEEAWAKAETLEGKDGEFSRRLVQALITMTRGFATQFRDSDSEKYKRASGLYEDAIQQLNKLSSDYPEESQDPGFKEMQFGMEIQAIQAMRSMAKQNQNKGEVAKLNAQIQSIVNGLPDDKKEEYKSILAFERYGVVMKQFSKGTVAIQQMDLEAAVELFSEIKADLKQIRDSTKQINLNGAIFVASNQILEAAPIYIASIEVYATVLHRAIIGDVYRDDVEKLKAAEKSLHTSADDMANGMFVLIPSDAHTADNYLANLKAPAQLLRNLRRLCRESLKPKSLFAAGGSKAFIMFLITAIILVVLQNFTSISDDYTSGALFGYILILSLIVGCIGGFGLESLRLLPFIDKATDVFTKAFTRSKD